MGAVTLEVAPPESASYERLDAEQAIGDAAVASGYSVRLAATEGDSLPAGSTPVARLRIVGGPEVGREIPLLSGSSVIGRDPSNDITLKDPLISKRHARINVGDTVELVDLNSANGIMVDGGVVARVTVQPGQNVLLGDTEIAFDLPRGLTAGAVRPLIAGSAIPFNRSPRVEPRYPGHEYARPEIPREIDSLPFPWLLMIAPILLGGVVYFSTKPHNPLALLFVAMSPMMMTANYFMQRQRSRHRHAAQVRQFESQLAALVKNLEHEVPFERETRNRESLRVEEVLAAAVERTPVLWTRRPEHWSFLHLRLGTGTASSRNTVARAPETAEGMPEFSERLDAAVEQFAMITDVPLVEDPLTSGAIGAVGETVLRTDYVRGLVLQLALLHSPAELVIASIASPQVGAEFEWLKWLPHTSSPHTPISGPHLADSGATAGVLVSQLEELVAARLGETALDVHALGALDSDLRATSAGSRVGSAEDGEPPILPIVVVLISDEAPVDRGRLVQLAERASAAGIVPIWMAERAQDLPGLCRTVVDLASGGNTAALHFVRHGEVVQPVAVEVVTRSQALRVSRQVSGLVDSGAFIADASDLPTNVPILSLLGNEMAEAPALVVDRWYQNFSVHDRSGGPTRALPRAASLRALVGQAGADAMHLDLRSQGPHALVGGTTGSGKSEFLQAWVLGMAAEYSPDRLTFLFVDYKGGAAFAECVDLPHCVGLVTDLSPHLVRRALTSLRAELRFREHLFRSKKAKDLLELERRGDPACPPALVLVIDEFAALATEVPDFVDGVVDIAQRGRSLGIHLIMATQRPAGVIKDNLRANTNLRIALRMADETDSIDVVGSDVAGRFDPGIPGRAIAKTGPGRLVPFQSAYAGSSSSAAPSKPTIQIAELRFGADIIWSPAEDAQVPESDETGPSDQHRLVATIAQASATAGIPAPRRPWLPELSRLCDLAALGPRSDRQLILGVSDLPEQQLQVPVFFLPDLDGHLVVYGTGGSGKTVVLRTLAAGAGITPRGGPVDVFALDFASGGLSMLEVLPHVGSVIPGEDSERVARLLRQLKDELERRGREYSSFRAGTIDEYRTHSGNLDEPRIMLLVDGFPAFRNDYEAQGPRGQAYSTLLQLLSEGRQLGIHVVLTADRPGAVPSSVASSIPRRIVLRLADETMYTMLDVPVDVLGSSSPPGRAVIDDVEVQVAILGGASSMLDQAAAIESLASAIDRTGRSPVPPIASLATRVSLADLPDRVADEPVLGLSDHDLQPIGFRPTGVFLLGGAPQSGRATALSTIVRAMRRFDRGTRLFYLGNRRSNLAQWEEFEEVATDPESVADLARKLTDVVTQQSSPRIVVATEDVAEFLQTPAEAPLTALVKAIKRSDHFLVAEAETGSWGSSWPLLTEIKSARRGVLLQPDSIEAETILRISIPRTNRSEFPPGRGIYTSAGRFVRVQLPVEE